MSRKQVSALTLRQHLLGFLNGSTTLTAFDDWFTTATWEDADVAPDARELAGQIGLLIAEYTGGAWTRPELETRLRAAASSASVVWGSASAVPRIRTGSTSSVISRLTLAT